MVSNKELVTDYMTTNLITFTPDIDIRDATKTLLQKQISGAPVVDRSGHLVGMLSEVDCIQTIVSGSYNQHPSGNGTVQEFMSANVHSISSNTTIDELAHKFVNSHYRRFPVVANGKLMGQISRRDVLKAILKRKPEVEHVPSSWKPRVPA